MHAQWILSKTSLPCTGKPVDFLLADRSVPIHGTFDNGVFHAHWADYGADRVDSWCESDDKAPVVPFEAAKATITGRFVGALKRWSSMSDNMASTHSPRKQRT
jgi:hypothetical protein